MHRDAPLYRPSGLFFALRGSSVGEIKNNNTGYTTEFKIYGNGIMILPKSVHFIVALIAEQH